MLTRFFCPRFVAATLLLAFLVPASGVYAQKAAVAAPAISVAPIVYKRRVLANGLTVYSVQNKQNPTVAIQVWYKVGSKNDPPGRSGFAHLFEHIMFKGTRNMKDETLDRLTEDVGGENNAFTQSDVTVYHETVPSNYLPTLLWAEADRMASLSVNQAAFVSERAVVEEEYRQSVLAPPYGLLENSVDIYSWAVHPYKRPTIGSIHDLDSSTLADVRAFHDTFYRPDNAVLLVVGDFEQAALDGYVNRYFGRIKRPNRPIPRVTVTEPPRKKEKRVNETGPNVPLPALVMTFLTVKETSADAEPLRVLDTLLSGGEASRLYRSLVYEQQVASEAGSSADLRPDAGLFQLSATAASGKTLDAVEKSLLAQVEKIKKTPPTQAELIKARNQILSSTLNGRETNDGVAFALANAAVLDGDPARVNTDLARLQAVTAQDVQRVAQKYLTAQNRVVIRYGAGKTTAQTVSANPTSVTGAAPPFKPLETPPSPTTPRPLTLPTPTEKTLANGLRVVAVPGRKSGLVSVELVSKTGGATDPNDKAGLADFSASLLTKGTKTRTAPQIASQIEALGGSISSGASYDSATISMGVLKTNVNAAFSVFADVALHPAFAPAEIDRLRAQTLDDLTVGLQSPGTIARYAANRVVFGDGPYGHPLGGTPQTLPKLSRADVQTFHDRAFVPANCVLVVGGDITPDAAFALAEKFFGTWSTKNNSIPNDDIFNGDPIKIDAVVTPPQKRVLVIDKPGAGQAAVLLTRPAIGRSDPDYYAGVVANTVLGGGYSARLNREVRVKRGLSYGASSGLTARRNGGIFSASAQTKNPSAPEVAVIFRDELQKLSDLSVAPDELTPRKASLSGDYARRLETGAGLVGETAGLVVYDLPLTTLADYLTSVQAVGEGDVKKFAADHLGADDASLIIVGDAAKFLPALKKQFPQAEVIPFSRLDLNRADLKKQP